MGDQFELERRVKELEAEVTGLRGARYRGRRYRSAEDVGGLAIGTAAFGGGAAGYAAIGGGALGYYACGGGAAGVHASSALRRDAEAVEFFARYGLESACTGRRYR